MLLMTHLGSLVSSMVSEQSAVDGSENFALSLDWGLPCIESVLKSLKSTVKLSDESSLGANVDQSFEDLLLDGVEVGVSLVQVRKNTDSDSGWASPSGSFVELWRNSVYESVDDRLAFIARNDDNQRGYRVQNQIDVLGPGWKNMKRRADLDKILRGISGT